MIFPFEITYKKKLTGEIENYSTLDILDFAKKDFEESGAIKVKLNDGLLIAENPFGYIGIRRGLNWNRWIGVSKASMMIVESTNNRVANYKFSLLRIWIVGAISGFLFWGLSQDYWAGIAAFGVLGFLNWIGKLIQHWITFDGTFGDLIYEAKRTNRV